MRAATRPEGASVAGEVVSVVAFSESVMGYTWGKAGITSGATAPAGMGAPSGGA